MASGRPFLSVLGFSAAATALLVGAIAIGAGGESLSAVGLAGASLCSSGALWLFACAGGRATQRPLRAALGLGPGRLAVPELVVVVVGTLGLSHLIDLVLRVTGWRSGSALELLDNILSGSEGFPLALAVLGVGIAPGIGEELLFRGLILRALHPVIGVPASILLSAALFAAAHLEPVQAGAALLIGLYLGLVAVAAGSTRAAILCHVANNLMAVIAAAWPGASLAFGAGGTLVCALAAAAGFGVALRALKTSRAA